MLRLEEMLEELDRNNRLFERLYSDRTKARRLTKLPAMREGTDQAFYRIVDMLNALHIIFIKKDKPTDFQCLIEDVMRGIDNYLRQAENSYSRRVAGYRN